MNINKSYIKQAFKQAGVQLSEDALALIVHDMRKYVSLMALRCKRFNIKRLTSDQNIMGMALGNMSINTFLAKTNKEGKPWKNKD